MRCQQARCSRTIDLSSSGSRIPAPGHSRVKHIDAPLEALRQSWTEDQGIDIIFIETHKQLGDALTKTLTPTKHWGLFKSLMNLPIPMQA